MKKEILQATIMLSKRFLQIFCLQVLVISLALAGEGNTQNKSLSMEKVFVKLNARQMKVLDVLSEIESQTHFRFTYEERDLDTKNYINVKKGKHSIYAVLSDVGQKASLNFRRLNDVIDISKPKKEKDDLVVKDELLDINVSGKITDASGMGLPGVSILVKGTTNGTTTNIEGDFKLTVPDNAILIVSSVGYETQEISVSGRTTFDILLEESAEQLGEVVVTALGISKEVKTLGYATQKVESKTINRANTANLGNMLTGQVAGLTVQNPTGLFQAPSFKLRGKTPLIVLDGIPIESDMYDLSANDIAGVNVLKGTTASALYGSRGKNGAILITTKKAKAEGLNVNVNHATMITAGYTVFPKTQTEYGNGSNGQYEFWDGKDGGISDGDMIWGPKFEPGVMVKQWNSPILDNVTGEQIPWWGDVSGTQYDDKSRYSRVPIPWEYHNNLKDFMRTGVVTTTDFDVSYKSEKVNYRMSGKYGYQKGQVPNTALTTGGLTFNSSIKLTDKLTLNNKLAYNKVYSGNFPRHGYGPKNHMYTILIWMGDDVNGRELDQHRYIPGQEGYRQANFNYAWYNNVYFAAHELNQVHDANVLNGLTSLNWQITDELSIQGRLSAINRSLFEDRQSPKSYLNYGDPREGDYKIWNSNRLRVDSDVLVTYDKELSSKVNLNINAGASSFRRDYHQEYNATDGLIVPFVYSLNNTRGNVKASNFTEREAIRSVYSTVSLDLFDAFFLTVAARNDWSSTLPKSNRSYFYPSASLSTMLSRFINLPDAFDYLKVTGAWAQVSSGLDPYQISPFYNNAGLYGGQTKLSYSGNIVNPNIAPEKSTSFELGLAASFVENRLGFNLTYYNVLDENQIIDLPISPVSGFNNRKVNGNEFRTTGIEAVINAMPIKQADLQWDVVLNLSHRVRKLASVYGGGDRYGNYRVGERMDNYYATGWMKSADGQLILSESNGLPTRDSFAQLHGHLDPDLVFGFQNTLRYKKFKLDVGFDGVKGGVMRSLTVEKMWWGGKHPNSTEYRDAEYAAGEPVYVPEGVNVVGGELVRDTDGTIITDTREYKPNTTKVSWQTWSQQYPYRAQVTEKESKKFANVFDRSFIKLRTLTLSYDMTDMIKSDFVKGLEMSVYGYNLFIIKKADIIDPDFGNDNSLQDPSARYVGMKVNLKF